MLKTPRIRIKQREDDKSIRPPKRKPDNPHHRTGIRSSAGVIVVRRPITGLPSTRIESGIELSSGPVRAGSSGFGPNRISKQARTKFPLKLLC